MVDDTELVKRRQQVIKLFCTKKPPKSLVIEDIETGNFPLQEWICNHCKEEFNYATGISIMDAAWLVAEAEL